MIPIAFAADGGGLGRASPRLPPPHAHQPELDVFEARGLMVSFGLMFLVQNFAQMLWGGDLRGYDFLTELVTWAPRSSPPTSCCCSRWRWLPSARADRRAEEDAAYGRACVMQSPTGAQLVGIDTERLHPLMFGVGLGLSGVAGCLVVDDLHHLAQHGRALYGDGADRHHAGRLRQHERALVGGLRSASSRRSACTSSSPSLKALLSYGIFIAVLLWRPNGLFHPQMNTRRDLLVLRAGRLALAVPHYGSDFWSRWRSPA